MRINNSMISAYDKGELDSFLNRTQERKDYFTFGAAFHKWFLEEDDFGKEFCLHSERPEPAKSFNYTANKEWRKAIYANMMDVISDNDLNRIIDMKKTVLLNPEIERLVNHPAKEVEQKIEWEVGEVQYKGRYDLRVGDKLIDFKTTEDCFMFEQSIMKYKYYRQGAMYLDGSGASQFILIAVEKTFPYNSACYVMDEELLEMGRKEYKRKGKEIWNILMK